MPAENIPTATDSSAECPVAASALGAAGVALVETEIQLYTSFQPSRPTYDVGVDLRAITPDGKRGVNIQVKASSKKSFSLNSRWEKAPNFLITFIWSLRLRSDAVVYVLSYREALRIIKDSAPSWLRTRSWLLSGGYSTTSPSATIVAAIERYRGTPDRWRAALLEASKQ